MKKYKITIPYWDTGVRKRFDIEFIIEAQDEPTAVEEAKKRFNSYEGSSYASWVRVMYEEEIMIEEVE